MTTYAVFDKDAMPVPAVVPERFSWFAALLPPVFAIVYGLWLELFVYVIGLVLLDRASDLIGGAASFWIYVLAAIWIGFEAPALRRSGLGRKGWRYRGDVIAGGDDLARLAGLASRNR